MSTTTADVWSAETIRDLVTEPLFRQSVILNSGLTRISTSATRVYVPVVGQATAAWHAELETITDAALTSSEVEVIPRKVATLQLLSNEALADTAAASLIGRALVSALADRVDHAWFLGDGPKGPGGLPSAGDAVTAVAGDPTAGIDAYIDAVSAIETVGAQASVVFISPGDWAILSKVHTSASDARPLLNSQPSQAAARSLLGLPVQVSRYCPDGTAYVMDAARVVVVDRQPGSVSVDGSAAFTRDGTYVRAVQRVEFAFPEDGVIAAISAA